MAARFTHRLRDALKKTLEVLDALNRPYALVGGLAVSAISVPRFTRDIDLAVAIADDLEAESVAFALQAKGYTVIATVEQEAVGRLATIRLRVPLGPEAPVLDLLFASCGIEPEIVAAAQRLEVLGACRRNTPLLKLRHLERPVSEDIHRLNRDEALLFAHCVSRIGLLRHAPRGCVGARGFYLPFDCHESAVPGSGAPSSRSSGPATSAGVRHGR